MAKKKRDLLQKLKKMKFGETFKYNEKIIFRNKFGYSVLSEGFYIGKSPKEAYDHLVNREKKRDAARKKRERSKAAKKRREQEKKKVLESLTKEQREILGL